MATRKKPTKSVFDSFQASVSLDTRHDLGWRWKKGTKIREKLEKENKDFPPIPHIGSAVSIKWSEKGRGVGEYAFWVRDGILYCDNECDSREAVLRVMARLVDSAVFIDDTPRAKRGKSSPWPKNERDLDHEVYPKKK